jgi:hypothetical protein
MTMNKMTTDQQIDIVVKALLAGAKALYRFPIYTNKDKGYKMNRLPLHAWVNSPKGRFLVINEISKKWNVSIGVIAQAVRRLTERKLAYVDTMSISADDVAAIQELLEKVLFSRKDNSTAELDSEAKIYIRDLACPKATTKSKSPVICPDWLADETAGVAELEDEAAGVLEEDIPEQTEV